MSTVYLGLGSNIEPEANVVSGITALRERFRGVELSPLYRAAAVGFEGNDFINGVARIDTDLGPLQVRQWLHDLEDRHGRARGMPKFSDRTLDIDILLYDDLWLLSPELEIPRDEILSAAHVLRPLAELAPDLRHPVTGLRLGRMWLEFAGDRANLERVDLGLEADPSSDWGVGIRPGETP